MRIFTKTYRRSEESSNVLTDFVTHQKFGNVIIGNTDNGGFISQLNQDKTPQASFQYVLAKGRLYFKNAHFLSDGTICVLAYTLNRSRRMTLYVLKIGRDGRCFHNIRLNANSVRYISSFHLLPKNELLVVGWYTPKGTRDQVYTIKIDANLNLIASKTIRLGTDDQLGGTLVVKNKVLLFGSQHSPNLRGFILQLDTNLNVISSSYLQNSNAPIVAIISATTFNNGIILLATIRNKDGSQTPVVIKLSFTKKEISAIRGFKISWEESGLQSRFIKNIGNELVIINYDSSNKQYISRLQDGQMISHSTIEFNTTILSGCNEEESSLYYFGNTIFNSITSPLLIKSNLEFECCKALELEPKELVQIDYQSIVAKVQEQDFSIGIEEIPIGYDSISFNEVHNCESPITDPNTKPNPTENPFQLLEPYKIQSDSINLQAAGSVGNDSARGIHLRWFLNGYLGDNHIPKGNHSQNNQFFNRKDDFFKIYKIPYNEESRSSITLDLFNTSPAQIHNNEALWIYRINTEVFNLTFVDETKYQQVLATINPNSQPKNFLEAYGNSVLEITPKDALSFAVTFEVSTSSELKIETFSVANKSNVEDVLSITSRKHFSGNTTSHRIVTENIKTIRISLVGGSLGAIVFENYSDFLLQAIQQNQITEIGNFALSKDDGEVEKRLEDSSKYTIDNHWKKFNDQSYVNKANYVDKWNKSDGLKEGVNDYITISELDPTATKIVGEETNSDDILEISLQKFINLASFDFHVARMLGLGTIDAISEQDNESSYIYLATYVTEKDVEDYEQLKFCQHLYLSLPTNVSTERLTQSVELKPLTYGLEINNATDSPLLITDEQGYAPYFDARYVKLDAHLTEDYLKSNGFFSPPTLFESSQYTSPVFIGIEHKKEFESTWRKPEIAYDKVYKDPSGNFETQTILFDEEKVNFIHEVNEEGIGKYATYGINIFSRASGLSNPRVTNPTKFKKANTLKAPININVQLIQDEDEQDTLLTTPTEQVWLKALDAGKKEILCRLDFDYTFGLDTNYNFGNRVGVFYRTEMPRNVVGKVVAVLENQTDSSICTLVTDSYYYISKGETVIPIVETALLSHFIGSNITYQSKSYKVLEVIPVNADGSNPKIVVQKNESREAISTSNNQNQLMQIYEDIEVDLDAAFLMVENLAVSKNWKSPTASTIQKFAFEIDLGHTQWAPKTENYTDEEQNVVPETAKGIWDTAKISQSNTSSSIIYMIECDNFILDNHSQFSNGAITNINNDFIVNWRKGHVRIHVKSDTLREKKRKTLEVIDITNVGTSQKLIFQAIDSEYNPTDLSKNIQEGNSISINFHPGYRVYFKEQASINFDKDTLLPKRDEGTKYGLIGLQTIDTKTFDDSSSPYSSSMGVPATLFARELIIPKQPKKPLGPLFANPPDFDNKANYSFNTEFEHMPWGMVYYRIDANSILSLLYKQETILTIKENLPKTIIDDKLQERWQDFLSFAAAGFKEFEVNDKKYAFPKPDNEVLEKEINQNTNASHTNEDIYLEAIHSNMLPLTEQPLIFQYLKSGSYVPQPKKQKIRDESGKMLHPTKDEDFDQSPMAKKISDTEVKFTDFTLDGNMNQDTIYFYAVRELSNSMQLGSASAFLGPVQLLNTKAPDALVIKKIVVPISSGYGEVNPEVHFYINKFSELQDLTHIEILRTTDSINAMSTRDMKVVKTIKVEELVEIDYGVYRIVDDFENEVDIPFGVPIYYKLRGKRTLKYIDYTNRKKTQIVYSEPTKTLLTNVIDMVQPSAPVLELVNDTQSATEITSISLKWDRVCHKGNYTLYHLNSSNVWEQKLEIQSNEETDLVYISNDPIPKFDEDDEKIYHKFKVIAENTSGLLSDDSNIFVI